ncbi:MAG: hypothetical protein AAFQ64_04850 [Pseudomonadota bacterium]
MISNEYREIAKRKITDTVNQVSAGSIAPIEAVRIFFKYRDVFGDLSDPIAARITALDDQTDFLIYDQGKLVNQAAVSAEDLKYFNDEIVSLLADIRERCTS